MDILKPDLVWIEGRCYRQNLQYSTSREVADEEFSDLISEESMLSAQMKKYSC
jgi:hypothetical protein